MNKLDPERPWLIFITKAHKGDEVGAGHQHWLKKTWWMHWWTVFSTTVIIAPISIQTCERAWFKAFKGWISRWCNCSQKVAGKHNWVCIKEGRIKHLEKNHFMGNSVYIKYNNIKLNYSSTFGLNKNLIVFICVAMKFRVWSSCWGDQENQTNLFSNHLHP